MLDAGGSTTLVHDWVVTCPPGQFLHTVEVTSTVAPGEPHIRDLNSDNDMLICIFRVQDTGFTDGDDLGIVTGFLIDGTMFMSADQVRVLNG